MSEYARRDIEDLGELYLRHVNAMTAERLHDKSHIAAELAWRDSRIADLLAACRQVSAAWKGNSSEKTLAAIRSINAAIAKATGAPTP